MTNLKLFKVQLTSLLLQGGAPGDAPVVIMHVAAPSIRLAAGCAESWDRQSKREPIRIEVSEVDGPFISRPDANLSGDYDV